MPQLTKSAIDRGAAANWLAGLRPSPVAQSRPAWQGTLTRAIKANRRSANAEEPAANTKPARAHQEESQQGACSIRLHALLSLLLSYPLDLANASASRAEVPLAPYAPSTASSSYEAHFAPLMPDSEQADDLAEREGACKAGMCVCIRRSSPTCAVSRAAAAPSLPRLAASKSAGRAPPVSS
jgi:hypothetical protein